MDKQAIETKVKEAIAEKIDIQVNKVKLSSLLVDDLGLDSFSSIELIFDLEEKIGIDIPDSDLKDVKSVNDIVEYINTRINGHWFGENSND